MCHVALPVKVVRVQSGVYRRALPLEQLLRDGLETAVEEFEQTSVAELQDAAQLP